MIKIFAVAALLVAALVTAKREHAFERSGVVSYCRVVAAPFGQQGEWRGCSQGWLTGYPDLSIDSCERMGRAPKVEFWRCPVPLTASRAP